VHPRHDGGVDLPLASACEFTLTSRSACVLGDFVVENFQLCLLGVFAVETSYHRFKAVQSFVKFVYFLYERLTEEARLKYPKQEQKRIVVGVVRVKK
jgi:hypothetical protein